MSKPLAAKEQHIKSYDPIWSQVRREAEEISAAEPALGGFIYANGKFWTITGSRTPYATALRAGSSTSTLDTGLRHKLFNEVIAADPALAICFAPT